MVASGGITSGLQVKLPKLAITRFDGTYEDWSRFWNQFVKTIDKTVIASVTKFAYLRELLGPKVNIEAQWPTRGYTLCRLLHLLKIANTIVSE